MLNVHFKIPEIPSDLIIIKIRQLVNTINCTTVLTRTEEKSTFRNRVNC